MEFPSTWISLHVHAYMYMYVLHIHCTCSTCSCNAATGQQDSKGECCPVSVLQLLNLFEVAQGSCCPVSATARKISVIYAACSFHTCWLLSNFNQMRVYILHTCTCTCTYMCTCHVRIYMYMYVYTYIVSGKLYGAISTGYNVINVYNIVLLLGAKAV